MNNNRGNNRRRGRGSNRQQGGQPLNRVDSRARGNAPQLLEKYRKMAHDAHLNGDRVQEEYYLQFADHYFRVLADQKRRQEESRQQRRDERPQDQERSGDGKDNTASADGGENTGDGRDRNAGADDSGAKRSAEVSEETESVRSDNPFVRESRGGRQRRRPREDDENREDAKPDEAKASAGLDPSALPPPISGSGDDADGNSEEVAEPKPRRRARRTPPPTDDSGDSLEAVS